MSERSPGADDKGALYHIIQKIWQIHRRNLEIVNLAIQFIRLSLKDFGVESRGDFSDCRRSEGWFFRQDVEGFTFRLQPS